MLDGNVLVTDAGTGAITWSGRPLDMPVRAIASIRSHPLAVVLLDSYGAHAHANKRRNLVCIDSKGAIQWQARLPTNDTADTYTEMHLVSAGVSAFSWSCHRVLLDTLSGKILKDAYTK
jgi:hypothetical protein